MNFVQHIYDLISRNMALLQEGVVFDGSKFDGYRRLQMINLIMTKRMDSC